MIHQGTPSAFITSFGFVFVIGLAAGVGCSAGDSDGPLGERTGCVSSVDATGLLCTTCDGDTATSECRPAACDVIDRCLQCTDPAGNVGTDCSIDYGEAYTSGWSVAPEPGRFASCALRLGIPHVSGTTCHFPGTTTCEVTETPGSDWRCLNCRYPDGSGSGTCTSDPLPDPLDSRPDDLPPPGRCVDERGPDGAVTCTTCTRDDLSATRSCHYPGVIACEPVFFDPDGCLGRCSLENGSVVRLCNSPRGPHLVPEAAP